MTRNGLALPAALLSHFSNSAILAFQGFRLLKVPFGKGGGNVLIPAEARAEGGGGGGDPAARCRRSDQRLAFSSGGAAD